MNKRLKIILAYILMSISFFSCKMYQIGYINSEKEPCEIDFFNMKIPSKYQLLDSCYKYEYGQKELSRRQLKKLGAIKQY